MSDQTCRFCKGELEPQRVTRLQRFEDHWILIENVPALVCLQCGETYYTPQALDLVIDLISGESEPSRTEEMQVFDAASHG